MMSVFFFVVFVLLSILATAQGQFGNDAHSQEPQCKPKEPTKYDWETLNYYELLGLTGDDETNKKKKKKKRRSGTPHSNASSNKGDAGISAKEIRKAYRKQAQKYHPDKQAAKKKSSESDTNSNSNSNNTTTANSSALSLEESNARFAKIAEAYEFLLDETKRKDYDLFLEYCQNTEIVEDDEAHEGRLSTMLKKRFGGLFDHTVDPFKVFKDAFQGLFDEDDHDDSYFDPNDPFSHLRYESNPRRHPNHQEYHQNEEPYQPQGDPARVFQDKKEMYDPMTGENVIRVLQTEEYPPSSSKSSTSTKSSSTSTSNTRGGSNSNNNNSSSSFYYRVIAQDFKERYDPFTAKQVYVPITEPYLQEDGFRTDSKVKDHHHQTAKSASSTSVESILHPWEVLTPRSPPMVSPNKRYIAGLSADCELLVMLNPDRHQDTAGGGYTSNEYRQPEILWSSKRPYGTNGYAADHCFALLKGPHLVVTVGQNPQQQQQQSYSNNNRILWHSDGRNDEDDSRHGYYEYEDEFGFWHKRQRSYLAQLDNDGSLTVYSVWSVPQDEHEGDLGSNPHSRRRPRRHKNEKENDDPSKVLVANVARAAKDFWHGRIPAHEEFDHLYSSSRSLTYKRCVYSTHGSHLPHGIGCYRISRKLHQLSLEATLAVRKLFYQINTVADAWLDLIYEEDDLFYFFKESIRKQYKNTLGSKLAGSSARWVRKVLEHLKQLHPKK